MKEHMMLCCRGDAAEWRALHAGQRWARLTAGVCLLVLVLVLPWSAAGWIALAVALGWVGATHVVAAAMAYPGCPELGAVPSLLSGRSVKTVCIPWRWLDKRLHLTAD